MTPEIRQRLEEIAEREARENVHPASDKDRSWYVIGHRDGAQVAWEMRDSEVERLKRFNVSAEDIAITKAVKSERERCAEFVMDHRIRGDQHDIFLRISEAIREGSHILGSELRGEK